MPDEPQLSSLHCRAARALLGMSQAELAGAAGVGLMTVKRLEQGRSLRGPQALVLRAAFERRGVLFLDEGSMCDGSAVRVGVALLPGMGPAA